MSKCSCPTKTDESGHIVRAYLDQRCPVHGETIGQILARPPHCQTCSCGTEIIQTPKVAAEMTKQFTKDKP
jgi:hypothetical protein